MNNFLLRMLELFLTLDRSSIYHSLQLQLREEQKYIFMQWLANSLNFKELEIPVIIHPYECSYESH